jgi:hypothetical protein
MKRGDGGRGGGVGVGMLGIRNSVCAIFTQEPREQANYVVEAAKHIAWMLTFSMRSKTTGSSFGQTAL